MTGIIPAQISTRRWTGSKAIYETVLGDEAIDLLNVQHVIQNQPHAQKKELEKCFLLGYKCCVVEYKCTELFSSMKVCSLSCSFYYVLKCLQ